MSHSAFIAAQAAALRRADVPARARTVDVPSLAGSAQVLVAGRGPPVVLLNGIGTPAAMWAPLMARLEGFTLFAVDLPGYGLTDTTEDFADDLRANAVRFLLEVLDGLGLDRPAVLGNSLGSLWAMWFAIEHPDRVAALVHVGCPAVTLGTSAPLPMRLLSVRGLGRAMMRLRPPSPAQVAELSRMVREDPLPGEIADLLVVTEQMEGFEAMFLATLHRLLRLRGARQDYAMTAAQLARVPHPSLLVIGADDPMGARDVGEEAVAVMADAELHVVDGGHAPWLHHADQIAPPVMAFLRRIEPGPPIA